MACCLPPPPDSEAVSFLKESAQQLLSRPPILSPDTGGSPWQALLRPKPGGASAAAALPSPSSSSFTPLDALSLISLHCSSLEFEPAARSVPAAEGAPDLAAPCCSGHPRRAPGGHPGPGAAPPLPPRPGAPPEPAPPPKGGVGGRLPRKQPRPRRSCQPGDPAFQGVALQMQLRLGRRGPAQDCRLLIRARYHSGKFRKRSQIPLAKEEDRQDTSEEEDGCLSTHRNKRCASCQTRKTPLWRDAEDGTPLCNACGIRYKKYRIRCFRCWNIPKHGGKPYSHCFNCGGRLRIVTTQQKSGKRCATS